MNARGRRGRRGRGATRCEATSSRNRERRPGACRVGDAPDSVAQPHDVEVDEQPERLARQAEVCEELRPVDGLDLTHALELDNKAILDDKVQAIGALKRDSGVLDAQGHLAPEPMRSERELPAKAGLVGALEQPRSQGRVHSHRAADHRPRELRQHIRRTFGILRGIRGPVGLPGCGDPSVRSAFSAISASSALTDPVPPWRIRLHGVVQRASRNSADNTCP